MSNQIKNVLQYYVFLAQCSQLAYSTKKIMSDICADDNNGLYYLNNDQPEDYSSDDDQCCATKRSSTQRLSAEEKKNKSLKGLAEEAFPNSSTFDKLESAETGGDCYVMWQQKEEKIILAFRGTEAAKEKNKLTSDAQTRTVK